MNLVRIDAHPARELPGLKAAASRGKHARLLAH